MSKYYFTFGQVHINRVNGHTLDKDCVAVINASDFAQAREQAFTWFGDKFHQQYSEEAFSDDILQYFPRGLIEIN